MDRRCDEARERPLHILCYLHAVELGGVERAAVRLCGVWGESARVTLALGRGDAPPGMDGVAVVHAPRPPVTPRLWEAVWMLLWLPGVLLRAKPDVLFCAGNTYTVVAVAMKLLLGGRCPPIVAKVSNSLDRADLPKPVRRMHALWCRVQGRAIDRFVAMTPEMAYEARETLGLPASRTTTIASPLFHDSELRPIVEKPVRPASGLLVAIGRLERQKNLPLLLEAFATLGPDRRLAIVGEGRERSRLRALVDRLGLADRVTLTGHCRDVAPWLRQADALVLSSDYEGVPAVVLEAMAAGLPVIATDCCASMAGLLAHGRGIVVPRRDAAALAARLQVLPPAGHDPAAQRAFARCHGVREAAASYLPLFRSLAGSPARADANREHAFS